MMRFLKQIGNFIMYLMSYSIICCLSDDANFGTNDRGIDNFKSRIRISLFCFPFGVHIFYLFTYKKTESGNKEFHIIHVLNLNDILNLNFNNNLKRVTGVQEKYLSDKISTDVSEDKEFIQYLINNQNNRKNSSVTKMNTYTTIILAIIPLIIFFFKLETFKSYPIIVKILIILLLICLINITAFVFQFNQVKNYDRCTYSELKRSGNKSKAIVKMYYIDWQNIVHEADNLVTYITNIETYIKFAVYLAVIIAILNMIPKTNSKYINNGNEIIYNISLENLEKSDEDAIKVINNINNEIADKRNNKAVIIYNDKKVLGNKSFKAIYSYLNIYIKDKNIKIFYDRDSKISNNEIKVLLMEE